MAAMLILLPNSTNSHIRKRNHAKARYPNLLIPKDSTAPLPELLLLIVFSRCHMADAYRRFNLFGG